MFVMPFLLIPLLLILFLSYQWLRLFDWRTQQIDLCKYAGPGKKKILFVYPHPDDETMMNGGTIAKYANDSNVEMVVLSMTPGEHGDELMPGIEPAKLAKIRREEFQKSMDILGVKRSIVADFEDGMLKKQNEEVIAYLDSFFQKEKPDLVITYERGGIYGHPDHVALSEITRSLQDKYGFKVLYSTIPKRFFSSKGLPTHMAEDLANLKHDLPQFRVVFGNLGWKKYRAALCYRSQNLCHTAPLWAQTLAYPVEYYSEESTLVILQE